jgi:hypothetical protein
MKPYRRALASTVLALSVGLGTSAGVAAVPELTQPASDAERHQSLYKFAFKLLNCNRTGGKIRHDGTCKARGSGRFSKYRRPLVRHKPIGTRVAWPWARTMAIENQCTHELERFPGVSQRDRDGGYSNAAWGENIGSVPGATLLVTWSSGSVVRSRPSGATAAATGATSRTKRSRASASGSRPRVHGRPSSSTSTVASRRCAPFGHDLAPVRPSSRRAASSVQASADPTWAGAAAEGPGQAQEVEASARSQAPLSAEAQEHSGMVRAGVPEPSAQRPEASHDDR